MPKAIINTYSNITINQYGEIVRVNKIISEQENVPNISKEVNFGKYSKKLSLHNKVKSEDLDLGRE
ncbi:MAG: hypothetical protein SOV27_05060 [Eubacteriales bacterium]|nr:hypothetical protein [Eubacteriales bacterium]